MMFVRLDMFQKMEHEPLFDGGRPIPFLGFQTNVKFYKELPCREAEEFIRVGISTALTQLMQAKDYEYAGVIPVAIVTSGISCVNCYREDERVLYAYDTCLHKQLIKKLEPGAINLEFWKAIEFDNKETKDKSKR